MGRAPCCDKNGLKKGPWTPEEDQKLIDYIEKNGYGNWRTLPKNAGLQRCGKSCRLRWTNYLRPDIKRGRFSFEEEETIIQLHSILGNKWSAIAARLPGRTDNEIKNYWNTHIRKRLLRMGIDPVTHSPRLDLLDLSTLLNYSTSLYNNSTAQSHINFQRLLGMQPLISPDLIRLANSIVSSQRQNQDLGLMQNSLISDNNNHQMHHQSLIQPPNSCQVQNQVQDFSIPTTSFGTTTLPSNEQVHQLMQYDDIDEQFQGNVAGFGSLDYLPVGNYEYYELDQPVIDPALSSETSTFDQSNSSNNFGFQSVLSNISTPASSPAPLNSTSSAYNFNNSSSSSNDDERDISYCSNMYKFEIPAGDILDVNDFM